MAERKVKIGLIGFGKVGTGVLKLLRSNRSLIYQKIGAGLEIKRICDVDIRSSRGVRVDKKILTKKISDIINDPEIDIVIELIGGIDTADKAVISAIGKGKHVVTANKALMSRYWDRIFSLAARNEVIPEIKYEANRVDIPPAKTR